MLHLYKCKDLNKTRSVILPGKWRDSFGLQPGMFVEIFLEKESIVIQKAGENSTHNHRIVSEKGSVQIPKELLTLMKFDEFENYCIFIDDHKKRFKLQLMP
ncbi:AbrB/MazE/SpoVT family DNA-binding domain-containing protein [Falsibacillus pallidus]|uniref:AbrB/MazE/SpoVT family DNA-binding domain-containing protein n=1 Tax=Falsibacillus pallidus TaxID=493781 RepID=UPI003D96EDD7